MARGTASRPAAESVRERSVDGVDRARETRALQRDEFGGLNWGAACFGWLVAVGVATLLTAILSAAGAAIGLTKSSPSQAAGSASTIGIVGGILFLIVLLVAYFAGGYVAGRMSRLDGPRQGAGVWAIGLLVTILPGVAGVLLGAKYNVLAQLNLPRIPVNEGSLTMGGVIALVAVVLGTLLAAVIGGRTGTRYHRRIDNDYAERDRLEGTGSPRQRRREDREDRGDLPRYGHRSARVGARQDRAVRRQGHVRAAGAGQSEW